MKAVARLVALTGVLGAAIVLTAGASGSVQAPYEIVAASLNQDGQQLVWSVQLDHQVSPGALKRARRSLCLLLKRSPSAGGLACLAPGHRPGHPQLLYTAAGHNRAQSVTASIAQRGSTGWTVSFEPAAVGLAYKPVRWQTLSSARSSDCAAGAAGAHGCTTAFPSTPALVKLHTPKLVGCEARGPSVLSNGSPSVREVALTFDDGPWNDPPASAFLRVLEREHAVATFFEIGDQIAAYDPGGVFERRMLADGDMIGDHSWSHPDVAKLPASEQRSQLLDAAAAIRKATRGFTPCLWRPPYGDISPELVSLARSLGFLTILWDVDPRDWSLPGVNAIYSNVVDNSHNGAIVIQHFGGGPRYQTLAALPREIQTLRHRGYKLVTVAQLLGLRLIYK